jgi:hypothetical protein
VKSFTDAFGNDDFFKMVKQGKTGNLQTLLVGFLESYQEADVASLDLHPDIQEVCARTASMCSGLLALMVPAIGFMGSKAEHVAGLTSCKDPNSMQSTLKLNIQDDPFWEAMHDAYLKTATDSKKLLPQMQALQDAFLSDSDSAVLDGTFVEAVKLCKVVKDKMRPGASDEFQVLVAHRTRKLVVKLCEMGDVADVDVGMLDAVVDSLDVFIKDDGMLALKQQFLGWKGRMAELLASKSLSDFVDKNSSPEEPNATSTGVDMAELGDILFKSKGVKFISEVADKAEHVALKIFKRMKMEAGQVFASGKSSHSMLSSSVLALHVCVCA